MKVQNMTHAEQNARGHMDSIKAIPLPLRTCRTGLANIRYHSKSGHHGTV
jgi:hypothetical protein